jgi:hypothetical protein
MTIYDLIRYCEIRLEFLKNQKTTYIQLNEYDMVNKIEMQILESEITLNQLKNSNS